jgi:hypothetical protein
VANLEENLTAGIFVLAELGFAVCLLALLGSRNRRKSFLELITNRTALLDPRNVTSSGHRWQRRMRWLAIITVVTLLLLAELLDAAQSSDAEGPSLVPTSSSTGQ